MLKPHYETLVQSYVFPQLTFNAAKQELWNTDPADYIRMSVDEYETHDTPVSAATTFLLSLAGSRTKTTFMSILALINRVLQSKPPAPERFGALNMTSALGPLIMRHPDVKGNMEQFLTQHVLPEFRAQEPYMRAIVRPSIVPNLVSFVSPIVRYRGIYVLIVDRFVGMRGARYRREKRFAVVERAG